ncbi:MAG: glycoside hydrolase N-terminal domain-containing protein [Clostridia bacterium]|nr:glycoside hydrolase N-terminal domain-containing protein [Clostridia bacterium]
MNTIRMDKPAGWAGELWRESLPLGNGLTSALLCGSVGCEHFWVNRFDRWEGGEESELPDVSGTLALQRERILQGRYAEANGMLAEALAEKGYRVKNAAPMAPVEIRLRFESEHNYRRYSRGLDLDTGEAFVSFDQGEAHVERRAFVSRRDDQAVLLVRTTGALRVRIDKPEDERLTMRVRPEGGVMADRGAYIEIDGAKSLLIVARFDGEPLMDDYDRLLARHAPLHRAAMGSANLALGDGGDHANEALLDEAHQETAPVELIEKLWRFGRYLFACGTAEGGYPFPLYGLWGGKARLMWSQHVANENVEMIYWHAPVGGFAHLLRPLIHYYSGKLDAFRESARKVFGCRGIYVSAYTTPLNSRPAPNVPVIVNYIGAAGWLCHHFYDYYRYTGDEELLREEILPFMLEAAAFYEDYARRDERGKLLIMPSVSPENTPGNFMPEDFQEHMGHINPVVWNATMDFAIIKELLTNLLALHETHPQDAARVEAWRSMLRDMPDYMLNRDGAIREWMDERLEDFYTHRHLSHLYPLFPGEEIHRSDELFDAFARAVDMRRLGGMSGWALAHMACIDARLGRGEQAVECLDTLAKGCLLLNLFTLHNDWRDMGVSLRIDAAPVQLDALMGAVNAVQEMLLRVESGRLELLPACPARLNKGRVTDWRFPGGAVSFEWDLEKRCLSGEVRAERAVKLLMVYPAWSGKNERELTIPAGERLAL